MPAEPEALGLLALMLHCKARRAARYTNNGEFLPLDRQDTALWSRPLIDEAEAHLQQALILPMELNLNGKIARMFSTVTTVATPNDVTLQELHVEVFYPADAETEATLQAYEEHAKAIFGEAQSAS
jgi:predicted RNA polymerase sigma factor